MHETEGTFTSVLQTIKIWKDTQKLYEYEYSNNYDDVSRIKEC